MFAGFSTKIVDNLSSGRKENIEQWLGSPRFHFFCDDLRNPKTLNKIMKETNVVFHLATNANIPLGETAPYIQFNENIIAALNVLEAMKNSEGAKTIVYFSSSTVYGEPCSLPCSEEYNPLLPISVYGASKLGCEALISAYCHAFGLRGLILRLANIVGGRSNHGVVVDFMRKLEQKPTELEILGDGNQTKSYLYIDDCIDAIDLAFNDFMSGGKPLEIYNVGSSDQVSVRQIAEFVIDEIGLKNVELRYTGGVDGGRGWIGDVKNIWLDCDKIAELGWRPKFNSEEAIRQACRDTLLALRHARKGASKSVSIIIPTLNEEDGISKVLAEIPSSLTNETIVVDSSTDDTPEIARSLGAKIVRRPNIEYGKAIQVGVEKANGEIIVYLDGDHTYDPQEISCLIQPLLNGEKDVILGNRLNSMMLPGSMNPINIFGNFLISLVFSLLFFTRVHDTQTGFRAIKKSFLEKTSYNDYGMPYVTEQLIELVKKGARIGEVPITYRPRIGQTKLCRWTDGFKILKTLLRERIKLGWAAKV